MFGAEAFKELGRLGPVAIVAASKGWGRRWQKNWRATAPRSRSVPETRRILEEHALRINEMSGREVFWRTMDLWDGQVT